MIICITLLQREDWVDIGFICNFPNFHALCQVGGIREPYNKYLGLESIAIVFDVFSFYKVNVSFPTSFVITLNSKKLKTTHSFSSNIVYPHFNIHVAFLICKYFEFCLRFDSGITHWCQTKSVQLLSLECHLPIRHSVKGLMHYKYNLYIGTNTEPWGTPHSTFDG